MTRRRGGRGGEAFGPAMEFPLNQWSRSAFRYRAACDRAPRHGGPPSSSREEAVMSESERTRSEDTAILTTLTKKSDAPNSSSGCSTRASRYDETARGWSSAPPRRCRRFDRARARRRARGWSKALRDRPLLARGIEPISSARPLDEMERAEAGGHRGAARHRRCVALRRTSRRGPQRCFSRWSLLSRGGEGCPNPYESPAG